MRAAEAEGAALLPYGGGTQLQTGYPPLADKPYRLLSSARLNRILDQQPADLTVTCEPGVTLAELQAALAPYRQMLALDVPLPERATLGGIVAANTTGFWRPAYGAPRDLVIGLRAVMSGGVEVRGGGKVVKNVAGYDLCKLFTGSWGTLGVLTELTFRTRTRPEIERALAWDAPDLASAARVGLALHQARLAVTYVLATNEPEGRPRLILGLHGSAERVEWQTAELARLAAEAGLNGRTAILSEADVTALRDRQARLEPEWQMAARLSCLPTELEAAIRTLETPSDFALTAHCATGTLALAATRVTEDTTARLRKARPPGAHLVWTRLTRAVPDCDHLAVWGEPQAEFKLHRAIKQALDPKNTFSPGRFLGRL